MRENVIVSFLLAVSCLCSFAQRKVNIDHDWKFLYGDGSAAINDGNVVSQWRSLDLPHDWSVETEAAQAAGGTVVGPFSTNSIGKFQTGNTVGGEGWYAKQLHVSKKELSDGRLSLYFEGVYNRAEVYVNGHKMYFNPYGYSSFRVDVTDVLQRGDNTILVRVLNEGNNTRWYAGSGIYRHVWLLHTPLLHADEWDTYIQTDGETAHMETCIYNESSRKRKGTVHFTIRDAEGRQVGMAEQDFEIAPQGKLPVRLDVEIPDARKWSPETPYLYRAEVSVRDAGNGATDEIVKRVGVRSLKFSATEGFTLNGEPTLLRGGCVHHDNGLLGAAAYDCAEERKIQLLKAQGYNAVRCSHNIPSEHFLDACDSIGMMVIDEAFDQWLYAKNDDDYHKFFQEHSNHDLEVMVRRDRNHPCIIMWSIGNEIPGRIEPEGMAAAARLRETLRQYDTTRPITAAICSWDQGDAWNAAGSNWDAQDNKAFQSLDVGGYNYLYDKYERDHGTHPERVMFGAESYPKHMLQNWDKVEQLPYVIGDFIWTAMDYLGEAGIGSAAIRTNGNQTMFQQWPWYNGWCGDIDITGQKKPQSYYHDVVWHRAPVTMGVERPIPVGAHQSITAWGWQLEEQLWTYHNLDDKDTMTVNVYSRAPRVRLYLNGEAMGDKVPGNTYWCAYHIPYRPGTLRVVNVNEEGKETEGEFFELQTTTAPVGLRLTADKEIVKTGGDDLCYVTIELIDTEGRVITSDSETAVQISTQGTCTLMAAGNASPTDMASFRSTTPRLFRGRALAILRSGKAKGDTKITVKTDGLPEASLVITCAER